MTDTLLIVLIILVAITLLISICAIVYSAKKWGSAGKNDNSEALKKIEDEIRRVSEQSIKANATLTNQISNLENTTQINISKNISNEINDQFNKLVRQLGESTSSNQEATNKKFLDFQQTMNESMTKSFDTLKEQVNKSLLDINKVVNDKLADGFKDTNQTVTDVKERLAKIDAAQKSIDSLSGDVVTLKNILENNQSRGRFGEMQLSAILRSIFGDTHDVYKEQYTFEGKGSQSVRADAAIFLPSPYYMVCIDSKFPFQNFQKLLDLKDDSPEYQSLLKNFTFAVKKHIGDISDKYIVDGKTADFAFMFVPSEAIFSFIHSYCYNEVVDFASKKKVIICSPSTIQAMLGTINMLRIEHERNEKAQEILEQLRKLSEEFRRWSERWSSYSKSYKRVTEDISQLDTTVKKINKKFNSLNSGILDTNNENNLVEGDDIIDNDIDTEDEN